MLTEREDFPSRHGVDARHREGDVEAEGVIADEQRAPLREPVDALHLDVDPATEAVEELAERCATAGE